MPDASHHIDPESLERLRTGLRFIALRSLDADAAEDAVQETLTRGLQALDDGRLDDPAKLGPYFRSICRHVIVDTIRVRQRRSEVDELPDETDGDSGTNALESLITEERKARVRRALDELPPDARECLRLSFFEGLKPAEVAEQLGEPGPRVRKRRSRALQRLREAYFGANG